MLDLDSFGEDWRTTLAEIKTHQYLRAIPIIVLAASGTEKDIGSAYDLGVNTFIVKPKDSSAFIDLLKILIQYWFEIVELPYLRAAREF